MLIDSFCLFNEHDLLRLRLRTLSSQVDKFIISQSTVTHTGKKNIYNLDRNGVGYFNLDVTLINSPDVAIPWQIFKEEFRWLNNFDYDIEDLRDIYEKTHSKFNFSESSSAAYGRDFFQKEIIILPVIGCELGSLVVYSDIDEIPYVESIHEIKNLFSSDNGFSVVALNQPTYYYKFPYCQDSEWLGSKATTLRSLCEIGVNALRSSNDNQKILRNAGVHLSFWGGYSSVRAKLEGYSANDLVNAPILFFLPFNYLLGLDLFSRRYVQVVMPNKTWVKKESFILYTIMKIIFPIRIIFFIFQKVTLKSLRFFNLI